MIQAIKKFCKESEVVRALWHMTTITSAMLLFYFTDARGAYFMLLLGMILIFCDLERVRWENSGKTLPRWVTFLIREDEVGRFSGLGHFVIAGVIIVFCHVVFGLPKEIILCGAMFVAIGDPMARLVGKNIKIVKIIGTNKSLAGSIAFFVTGFLSAAIICMIVGARFSWTGLALGGICGTLIELYSKRWDNFTVPLWTTFIIWGVKLVT